MYESTDEDPRTDEGEKVVRSTILVYIWVGDCTDNPTSVLPPDDDLE